jgi:hypothetical protein
VATGDPHTPIRPSLQVPAYLSYPDGLPNPAGCPRCRDVTEGRGIPYQWPLTIVQRTVNDSMAEMRAAKDVDTVMFHWHHDMSIQKAAWSNLARFLGESC